MLAGRQACRMMSLLMSMYNLSVCLTSWFVWPFRSASGKNKKEVCEDKASDYGVDLSSDFMWGCRDTSLADITKVDAKTVFKFNE